MPGLVNRVFLLSDSLGSRLELRFTEMLLYPDAIRLPLTLGALLTAHILRFRLVEKCAYNTYNKLSSKRKTGKVFAYLLEYIESSFNHAVPYAAL